MNSEKSRRTKVDLKQPEQPKLDLRQQEDFTVAYANHIAVIQTGYDLKITFGRIDPTVGPQVILQDRAIVLPWPAVKTLIYLLQVQLTAYEGSNGHVPYPEGGITEPSRLLSPELAKLPKAKEVHARVLKLWDDFIAANPEVLPKR